VVVEAGIVIFPPEPGAAPSSRESNSSELLTLIALPVFFPPVTLLSVATVVLDRVLLLIFVLVVPVVVDRVGDLTVVLAVTLVLDVTVADVGGGSLNGGALESGWGLFTGPANVPVVLPLPPKPV